MNNLYVRKLRCILCNAEYDTDELDYVCPKHGYDGRLDVIYDYDKIGKVWSRKKLDQDKDKTIWRYHPLLPVKPKDPSVFLPVGNTPLYKAKKLGKKIGLNNLYLKCDLFNPTASLKDRASIIAVVKASQENKKIITTASCGNAAASLAALSVNANLHSILFVPKDAPKEKIAQISIYGSTVFLVEGNYDTAYDLCLQASDRFGWYSRNTGYNPYLSEGKKTVIFEIIEQLKWKVPSKVFVPVGDGCIIGSVGKGIRDLQSLGWIEKSPRIYGVQAEGAAPLYETWKAGDENIKTIEPNTIADSISVGNPRDGLKALRSVRESKGEFIKVKDKVILNAMQLLAEYAGIFAEPAGASALAGVISMLKDNKIDSDETVVVLVTGNGLKDTQSATRVSSIPIIIKPDIKSLEKVINKTVHLK
jgi:threonine synthase